MSCSGPAVGLERRRRHPQHPSSLQVVEAPDEGVDGRGARPAFDACSASASFGRQRARRRDPTDPAGRPRLALASPLACAAMTAGDVDPLPPEPGRAGTCSRRRRTDVLGCRVGQCCEQERATDERVERAQAPVNAAGYGRLAGTRGAFCALLCLDRFGERESGGVEGRGWGIEEVGREANEEGCPRRQRQSQQRPVRGGGGGVCEFFFRRLGPPGLRAAMIPTTAGRTFESGRAVFQARPNRQSLGRPWRRQPTEAGLVVRARYAAMGAVTRERRRRMGQRMDDGSIGTW